MGGRVDGAPRGVTRRGRWRPRREALPVKPPVYGAGVTVSVNAPDSPLSYPSTTIV